MSKMIRIMTVMFVVILVLSLGASVAFTQEPTGPEKIKLDLQADPNMPVGEEIPFSALESVDAFWTAENLASAQPLPLPIAAEGMMGFEDRDVSQYGAAAAVPGMGPDADIVAATLADQIPETEADRRDVARAIAFYLRELRSL